MESRIERGRDNCFAQSSYVDISFNPLYTGNASMGTFTNSE